MDSLTRSRIDALSAAPVSATVCQSVATAPRRASRLDGAIVVVKPAVPVPVVPASKRRAAPAAAAPLPPKVVRIPRDPALAAAEAARKAQAKAVAEAEGVRVAEEARKAAEAKAEADRIAAEKKAAEELAARAALEAEETRKAVEAKAKADRIAAEARKAEEAAERARRELQDARSEFATFVQNMDDAAFAHAWDGSITRDWLLVNAACANLDWFTSVRKGLEAGIARYRSVKAEADAEAARKAAEAKADRERLAKTASIGGVAVLGDVLLARPDSGSVQRTPPITGSGKRKSQLSIIEQLRANAANPVPVAGPRPSKAQMAEAERIANGATSLKKADPIFVADPNRSLSERVLALSPAVVARIHAQRPVPHTWPTIDRILNAVRGAKIKLDGRVVEDGKAIGRIETFVAWCEQA